MPTNSYVPANSAEVAAISGRNLSAIIKSDPLILSVLAESAGIRKKSAFTLDAATADDSSYKLKSPSAYEKPKSSAVYQSKYTEPSHTNTPYTQSTSYVNSYSNIGNLGGIGSYQPSYLNTIALNPVGSDVGQQYLNPSYQTSPPTHREQRAYSYVLNTTQPFDAQLGTPGSASYADPMLQDSSPIVMNL